MKHSAISRSCVLSHSAAWLISHPHIPSLSFLNCKCSNVVVWLWLLALPRGRNAFLFQHSWIQPLFICSSEPADGAGRVGVGVGVRWNEPCSLFLECFWSPVSTHSLKSTLALQLAICWRDKLEGGGAFLWVFGSTIWSSRHTFSPPRTFSHAHLSRILFCYNCINYSAYISMIYNLFNDQIWLRSMQNNFLIPRY